MAEIETAVAQVLFEVEEEKGRWFIRVQQQYVPGTAALRYGAMRQEAEELARRLNERVHSIVLTGESPAAERGA